MKHTEGSCHRRRQRSWTIFKQVIFPPSPAHELDQYQFITESHQWCYHIPVSGGEIDQRGKAHPLLACFTGKGTTDRNHRLPNQVPFVSSLRSVTFPSCALTVLQQHRETAALFQDAQRSPHQTI